MSLPAVQFPNQISFEDFLATIDEDAHVEWVDGQVVPMTQVSMRHDQIVGFIYAILRGYVRRKKIAAGVFHDSFQMKLGATRSSRVPDVAYVRPERRHLLRDTYLEGPADLAVEVVSPESRVRDRVEKFREYQQAGVPEFWLIDPALRSAEAYRLSAAEVYEPVELSDPPRLTCEALPGFWIDVAWLWQEEPDEWVAYEAWGLI
ncbi:MAG TPA: Uma2 family endonuclease [Longimicrobium sp.]|nr:Uma2 family endonuclease [Longimicrobium sp.]